MIQIVSFGTSNPVEAICSSIKSNIGQKSNLSVHRVAEVKDKPISLEDLYWIKNADAYLVDGTWGSTNPARQWRPDKIYLKEKRNLYHGRPSTAIRSARMEFMNVFVQELANLYNKKVIVTESPTLSRIKCNHTNTWYKNTGPRYYRMGLNHWTFGRTKWCKPKDRDWDVPNTVKAGNLSRLNRMITLTEKANEDIKLDNIFEHRWKNNKDGAVLICPGLEHDPTSTISVEKFIKQSVDTARQHTKREIIIKPHPGTELKIEDLVKDVEILPKETKLQDIKHRVYCAVLGESTTIFELINLGIPCITSTHNFGRPLKNGSILQIEDLYYATPEEVLKWYTMLSFTEFELSEFGSQYIIPYIKELLSD